MELYFYLEVLEKLGSVSSNVNNLLGKSENVLQIVLTDVSSHRDFGEFLDLFFDVLGQDVAEVGLGAVHSVLHLDDGLGVGEVVGDDLAHFGEVPAVPFAHSHDVVVQFFVQIVEERDRLKKRDEKRIS